MLFRDRLKDNAASLARHAIQAEVWEKAAEYLYEAGVRAWGLGALDESREHYERALGILSSLPETDENLLRSIDVRMGLGSHLFLLGELTRFGQIHETAEELCRRIGDSRRLARVCRALGTYHWLASRYRRGIDYASRALDLATGLNDGDTRIAARHTLAVNYFHLGEYWHAVDLFQGNVDGPDAELAKDRRGTLFMSPYILDCGYLACSFAMVGDFTRALHYSQRVVDDARAFGHPAGEAFAHAYAAFPYTYRGDYDAAIQLCEHATRVCEANGVLLFLPVACAIRGHALVLSGDVSTGVSYLERAISLWEAMGLQISLSTFYRQLASGLVAAGRVEEGKRAGEQALRFAVTASERSEEAEALRVLAEVAAATHPLDAESVQGLYERGQAVAVDLGMRPLVAHCHLGLGKLHRRTGKRQEAQDHLTTATTMYREMDMRFWLEQAEAEMRESG